MSDILRRELGVALSGVRANVEGYSLLPSTADGVYLVVRNQPALVKGSNGRYQVAVSTYRQQVPEQGLAITGGSAIFTIGTAMQHTAKQFAELNAAFQAAVVNAGAPDRKYSFEPLTTRQGMAEVMISPSSGKQVETFNGKAVGTPGGPMSFLVELTALGAQEWAQGVRERRHIVGGVKYQYEYLSFVPQCSAVVELNGQRVFEHLSAALDVSVKGWYYGGSAKLAAEWENMQRNGAITITFSGAGLSPEMEKVRTDLTMAFANQAREKWFNTLFAPAPEVEAAKPGDTSGFFGGANFALKWQKASESLNLRQEIRFEGWTWLTASADADITTMFADLDEQYVNEVNTEVSEQVSVTVDSDPQYEHAAVSTSFTSGRWNETKIFDANGGSEFYNVTRSGSEKITVTRNVEVNFVPPRWPVIKTKVVEDLNDGGNQEIIKPSSYVGRHLIYLFTMDGDTVMLPDEKDYLVVNVAYTGPHLIRSLADSGRLTSMEPLEFSYPRDPEGAPGKATFSAMGVIGGKLVRTKDQAINPDEEAIFVVATPTGITLASQETVFGEEEADTTLKRIVAAGARPQITQLSPDGERPNEEGGHTNGRTVTGSVIGLEYSAKGVRAIVRKDDGSPYRVWLPSGPIAEALDEGKRDVQIDLDEHDRAERVLLRF